MHGIDKSSLTWQTVEAWAKDKLRDASIALETPGLEMPETENVRAQVALCRELLGLATEPRKITPSEPHDYGVATRI